MFSKVPSTFKVVIPTIIAVVILLVAFYLMGGDSSGFTLQQFIGIVVAAAISGAITLLLLQGQSEVQEKMLKQQREGEARRDKDVKIYSNKISAFSAFNNEVWTDDLDNSEKAADNVENIRKQLYSKVILYLNASEVHDITKVLKERGTNNFPVVLSGIIDILNRNAEKSISDAQGPSDEKLDYKKACQLLWEEFNKWSSSYDEMAMENETDVSEAAVDIAGGTIAGRELKVRQAWHFCELDTTQLKKLNAGFDELSLVEYQEYWRTGLVKQVQKGDLVFLFRGAKKYAGAFIAKGWRVFEYDTERNVKEITSEGIPHVLPEGNGVVNSIKDERIKEILKQYDIYGSYDDGATSCANLVVDRLSYKPEGVQNPNTTYRKTISRYYDVYAVRLLEKFREAEKDNPDALKKIDALFA